MAQASLGKVKEIKIEDKRRMHKRNLFPVFVDIRFID
jgi:hypothetical protein